MSDDDRTPELDESLAIIEAEQRRAHRALRVNEAAVFGVWAFAWGVGYVAMFLSAGPEGQPGLVGAIVFGVLLVAAILATIVHIEGRTRDIGGPETERNTLLGWAWPLGFAGSSLAAGGIGRAGIDGEAAALVYNALPCLVVACLYMASGIAFRDRRQFVLGGWISVVVGIASLAGAPLVYLLMAILGGGGFAVGALHAARGDRAGR